MYQTAFACIVRGIFHDLYVISMVKLAKKKSEECSPAKEGIFLISCALLELEMEEGGKLRERHKEERREIPVVAISLCHIFK